jgi:hypothetical protein
MGGIYTLFWSASMVECEKRSALGLDRRSKQQLKDHRQEGLSHENGGYRPFRNPPQEGLLG